MNRAAESVSLGMNRHDKGFMVSIVRLLCSVFLRIDGAPTALNGDAFGLVNSI
jgi:hypothetical protein